MTTFTLEIATPEQLAYSEQIEQVTVPSVDGQLTILPHHVPLFATLGEGEVVIRAKGENTYLAIGGGFIEVTPKKTIVLVTRAVNANELNESAIEKARKEAQDAIEKGATGESLQAAQALLRSTLVDLKVARRRRRPQS
jgi:F-type H+-transporting ATPase subunit epsilon